MKSKSVKLGLGLRALAAVFLVCGSRWALSAENAAGAGDKPNSLPAPPSNCVYDGKALPWPVPDAKKVEALEKELKDQLPKDDFVVLTVGPWVIGTDLSEAEAKRFAASTIAVYAARIQKQLFTKSPRSEPVKVYLFKDSDSYTVWNVKLFKERPSTPYGYYSRARRALVMNIGTGGGTLLHEMAHAMAEADFEKIPAWLNEGLGSLFEASMDKNGKVVGFTNWRLTGLQRDLEKGTATKLKDLVSLSDTEFYGERSGSNYAASRYLMQYLQDNGKLEAFYERVRDGKDETPAASLCKVFDGKKTVDQIEADCFAWVKTLRLR
jgi:hypothetical protein